MMTTIRKTLAALYELIDALEAENKELKRKLAIVKNDLAIVKKDDEMLRRLLNDSLDTKEFTVIEGGLSQTSINEMMNEPEGAA